MAKNEVVKSEIFDVSPAVQRFVSVADQVSGLGMVKSTGHMIKTFERASAVASLDSVLTEEVMEPIMSLQGTRVGFLTDKDKNRDGSKGPGYPLDVVRNVVKEAILCGAQLSGNEINIIAGQLYATKNYYMRMVAEIEGLTDLTWNIGTPQVAEKDKMKIKAVATWNMNGVPMSIGLDEKSPCIFFVRVYDGAGVGADQARGKATRKLFKHIYETATGSMMSLPDADAEEVAAHNAKRVDVATVNYEDLKAGNPKTHQAVTDEIDEFEMAYSRLDLMYESGGKKIDDMLFEKGVAEDRYLMDLKGTKDLSERQAVIDTYNELRDIL